MMWPCAVSALSSGVAYYINSRTITCIITAAKQGQIPYLHDVLQKPQGKHYLGSEVPLPFPPEIKRERNKEEREEERMKERKEEIKKGEKEFYALQALFLSTSLQVNHSFVI